MNLWLHSIAYPVHALGPGLRAAIWVTGCDRRCPGCISPEMRDRQNGRPVPVEILAKKLASIELPLQGVTVSGGEPMDQADALLLLVDFIKKSRPDWNIVLYSGYTLADLGKMGEGPEKLAKAVDILIDGPYIAESPSGVSMAGSGNQVVHAMSPVGKEMLREIMAQKNTGPDLGLSDGDLSLLIGVPGNDHPGIADGGHECGHIPPASEISIKTP